MESVVQLLRLKIVGRGINDMGTNYGHRRNVKEYTCRNVIGLCCGEGDSRMNKLYLKEKVVSEVWLQINYQILRAAMTWVRYGAIPLCSIDHLLSHFFQK